MKKAITKRQFQTVTVIVGSLLLVPLIAMQITPEVNWSGMDFLIAGFLLLTTGLFISFLANQSLPRIPRLLVICVVLIIALLLWAELAVGIFGSPIAGS